MTNNYGSGVVDGHKHYLREQRADLLPVGVLSASENQASPAPATAADKPSIVPCKGCKRCCQGKQAIGLFPRMGDADPAKYQTQEIINPLDGEVITILAWKPNGDCVYLGKDGCEIYEDRPLVCRSYDCRMQYLSLTRAIRDGMIRDGIASKETFTEGKKRLHTLTGAERLEAIQHRKDREAA